MKVETTGVILMDVCGVQTDRCVAKSIAPVTAVWTLPARVQVNVCRPCLEEQLRSAEWQLLEARVKRRVDIAVYSPSKELVLVVEVKKEPKARAASKKWAEQVRHNLLTHAGIPGTPYFLLAVPPKKIYLWKHDNPLRVDESPDYEVEAEELFKPYSARLSKLRSSVNEYYYLELLVTALLKDLVESKQQTNTDLEWFYKSGLQAAVRQGTVVMQDALAA